MNTPKNDSLYAEMQNLLYNNTKANDIEKIQNTLVNRIAVIQAEPENKMQNPEYQEMMDIYWKTEEIITQFELSKTDLWRRETMSMLMGCPIHKSELADVIIFFVILILDENESKIMNDEPFLGTMSYERIKHRFDLIKELQNNFHSVWNEVKIIRNNLRVNIENFQISIQELAEKNEDVTDLNLQLIGLKTIFKNHSEEDFYQLFYGKLPNKIFRSEYKNAFWHLQREFDIQYQKMKTLEKFLEKNIKNFYTNKSKQEKIQKKRQENQEKEIKIFQTPEQDTTSSIVKKTEKNNQNNTTKKPSRDEKYLQKIMTRLDNLQAIQTQNHTLSDEQRRELLSMQSAVSQMDTTEAVVKNLSNTISQRIQAIHEILWK